MRKANNLNKLNYPRVEIAGTGWSGPRRITIFSTFFMKVQDE